MREKEEKNQPAKRALSATLGREKVEALTAYYSSGEKGYPTCMRYR